jgi:hypothetical protein
MESTSSSNPGVKRPPNWRTIHAKTMSEMEDARQRARLAAGAGVEGVRCGGVEVRITKGLPLWCGLLGCGVNVCLRPMGT